MIWFLWILLIIYILLVLLSWLTILKAYIKLNDYTLIDVVFFIVMSLVPMMPFIIIEDLNSEYKKTKIKKNSCERCKYISKNNKYRQCMILDIKLTKDKRLCNGKLYENE